MLTAVLPCWTHAQLNTCANRRCWASFKSASFHFWSAGSDEGETSNPNVAAVNVDLCACLVNVGSLRQSPFCMQIVKEAVSIFNGIVEVSSSCLWLTVQ